jgi:dihydrofolate reductase
MRISLIVAMSQNRVIGRGGRLPWRLAADLRRFKRLTMGHHLIMGRKTHESIGRTLPGRISIVISRQADFAPPGVVAVDSLDEALATAAGDPEVFVIGGGEVYQQALPMVDRVYLTLICTDIEGDTFFPEFATEDWRLVEDIPHPADDRNEFAYRFLVYDRRR